MRFSLTLTEQTWKIKLVPENPFEIRVLGMLFQSNEISVRGTKHYTGDTPYQREQDTSPYAEIFIQLETEDVS